MNEKNLFLRLIWNCIDNYNLSPRENETLRLCVTGKTSKEVAKDLDLSPRTIEHYIASIKTKLGVTSRSEMIGKVVQDIVAHCQDTHCH